MIDEENESIQSKLLDFAKTLNLSDLLVGPHGQSYILTGRGKLIDGALLPTQIKTIGKGPLFYCPDYMFTKEYRISKAFEGVEGHLYFQYGNDWFESLKRLYEKIIHVYAETEKYFPIRLSIYTFLQSLNERFVDFSFPSLIRSIETLVTLKPGEGASVFARRVKRMLPSGAELMFNFTDDKILKMIKDCYRIRSDAVHGKKFGSILGSKSATFLENEIHEHIYILHAAAKNTIRRFILDESLREATSDRASLEKYWESIEPVGDRPCFCIKHPELSVHHPEGIISIAK